MKSLITQKNKVNPETANKIGKLIDLNFLEEMKSNGRKEYEELTKWLPQVEFMTQSNNNYKDTSKLLYDGSEDIEEKLLSAFAPPDDRLSDDYNEHGIAFFLASRQEKLSKTIDVNKLTEWIREIPEDSKIKVINYILYLKSGQLKTNLVKKLCEEFPWIHNNTQIKLENVTSNKNDIEGDEDDGIGDPKYGKTGEEEAVKFYEQYYEKVVNMNDNNPENPGFDLECSQPRSQDNNLSEIRVEVKAITSDQPRIRITKTEWEFMRDNQENYELFIYSHDHGKPIQLIRLKKAWLTIQKSLKQLNKQKESEYSYGSKKIESVIGLQQNSKGNGSDILLNWHRLFRDFEDEDIEKFWRR